MKEMEAKKRVSKLRITSLFLFATYFSAWAIAQFGDDRNWIVAIAGTGITGTLLPLSLIATLIFALRKRWVDVGGCVVLSLAFLVVSGQLRFPPVQAQAQRSPAIKVMSFNVIHGWHGIEKVAKAIKAENVDAFCMQELGLGEDKAAIETLIELLPEYRIFSDGSRTSGTRLPVISERAIDLTANPYSWTMIEQVVLVGDTKVRICNVHAPSYLPDRTFKSDWPYWFRRWGELSKEQTDLIESELRLIQSDPTPTILCGDFNMTPIGRRYRIMAERGIDSFAATGSGSGWTMPSGIPLRRIDYVWAFNGVQPLSAHVSDPRASDHAAAVATLAVR